MNKFVIEKMLKAFLRPRVLIGASNGVDYVRMSNEWPRHVLTYVLEDMLMLLNPELGHSR